MIVTRHTNFRKNYKSRIFSNLPLHKKFSERLKLFIINRADPELHDHKLVGKWKDFRAFSITGDIRVIYKTKSKDLIELYDIGSHNQVY